MYVELNLIDFMFALNSQIKKDILYSKSGLKRSIKDYWYTKKNMYQIWYDDFNKQAFRVKNSLHTHHELTLNNH